MAQGSLQTVAELLEARRLAAPRLTAILPVKSFHPAYLRQAVESMLGQTDPRWRLLVVTEPDETADLAPALGSSLDDERVVVIANEGRKLSGAINTGMRAAETDFVGLLLGDDLWSPDAVEVLGRAIEEKPEADFFHSSRVIVGDDGQPLSGVYLAPRSFALADFRRGSPVKHLLCWRRQLALSLGGLDEELNSVGPDDYDFPWTMAEAGARFEAVPECLYLYRDHRESFRLTTHLPVSTHSREIRRIMRKHGVGRVRTELRVLRARQTFLRQCLYHTRLDRIVKERLGHDPRKGWRDTYTAP
jgi:glycosyltransferase involved in cell wall biosynthesis